MSDKIRKRLYIAIILALIGMMIAGTLYLVHKYSINKTLEEIHSWDDIPELYSKWWKAYKREVFIELITSNIIRELNKLKGAISINDITERLDEDELNELIAGTESEYKYCYFKLDAIRKEDSVPDYAKWLVSRMISDYEETMEHAKALENEYRKKLENLNVFDSASREFFKSISDDIKKQENLLKEMSKAGTIGEFPAMGISLIADMNREYELSMKDIEGILFYTDAKGNKHISEEGIGLFADVSKENMSKKQLELYNMLISYIYTDECDTKELNTIIHAFYREPVKEMFMVRNLKKAGASFIKDLDDELNKKIMEGISNNNQVDKAELLKNIFAFKKISKLGELSYEVSDYENNVGEYKFKLTPYGAEFASEFQSYDVNISVSTKGHGVSGALTFYADYFKKQIKGLEFNGKELTMGQIVSQIMGEVPGVSTYVEFIKAVEDDGKSKEMIANGVMIENAMAIDGYVTEINGDIVVRKGPNTEAIYKYLEKNGYKIDQKDVYEQTRLVLQYGYGENAKNFSDIEKKILNKLGDEGYEWIY